METSEKSRINRWCQKLLDLSLRNRLLNVRDVKQMIPLFCRDLEGLEDRLAGDAAVPVQTGDPTEALLVSGVTAEETKKRLKVLFRQAKTDLEESGVNTLFLGLGFLNWRPTDKDEKFYRAPLLLMPVKLVRKGVNDIKVARLDEETVVNATLVELLRSQFHLAVKDVDPLPMDESGVDVGRVLENFRAATEGQVGWSVTREAALGLFSFGKFVMWKDISSRMDELRKNPLVDHLVQAGGVYDDHIEVFPPEEVGAKLDPAQTFCPLSADASQMAAVLWSRLGKTFVLHGPPGTGKSQTITNLIADNLAHGRRVLFVSEKKAALDVVHRRLAGIGLKPFCLELHSNKSGKADVLSQFAEALDVPACGVTASWEASADALAKARDALNNYVKALHKLYPNGLSAWNCLEHRIAEGRSDDARLLSIDCRQQSVKSLSEARDCVATLVNDWQATTSEAVSALSVAPDEAWTPDLESRLRAAADELLAALSKSGLGGWLSRGLAAFKNRALFGFGEGFKLTREQVEAFRRELPELRNMLRYRATRKKAFVAGLSAFTAALEKGEIEASSAVNRFQRAYAEKMLEDIVSATPVLANFSGLNQDELVLKFRELDKKHAELTQAVVFAKLAAQLPRRRAGDCPAASELGILRRECEKKARQKPVRQLLAEIPHLAATLKPCFLMSPLSVAQYLPPDSAPFDLIVFDEASQIPVWDAIGVIARAKQLVVVGDPKQMPPTNFFQKGESEEELDDEDVGTPDMESILDECLAAGVQSAHLNWHYRSRHESLIAFSNHNYYGDRLSTFPSANTSPRLGVRFVLAEKGVYERKASRTNRAEAQVLVDYIFARLAEPDYKRRSLGVVTFSQAQKDLIEDLIDARREKEPQFEAFFGEDTDEPFFVKNLENVQGDERDVILFSICYAPDADGKFAMNFGPLNREGGERRLNVAITRAKEQVVVVSSIHGSQIDLSRTSAVGAAHLRDFLEFAEKGATAQSSSAELDTAGFPATVAAFLREKGWMVDSQVGSSSCRIDLGVRRRTGEGYLLAIECDGPAYAAQWTARDRDALRASVLKSLGWHVTRLWSVDWAFDRARAEKNLLGLLDALEAQEAAAKPKAEPLPTPTATGGLPSGVTALREKIEKPVEKTRGIDEISDAELTRAMDEVERDFGTCEPEALYKETLKKFGLVQLNAKARARLDQAAKMRG